MLTSRFDVLTRLPVRVDVLILLPVVPVLYEVEARVFAAIAPVVLCCQECEATGDGQLREEVRSN